MASSMSACQESVLSRSIPFFLMKISLNVSAVRTPKLAHEKVGVHSPARDKQGPKSICPKPSVSLLQLFFVARAEVAIHLVFHHQGPPSRHRGWPDSVCDGSQWRMPRSLAKVAWVQSMRNETEPGLFCCLTIVQFRSSRKHESSRLFCR